MVLIHSFQGGLRQKVDDTKELATDDQIKGWIYKYGCEEQKGTIFIKTADWSRPDISFSKDSGISDEAKNNFIISSSNGVYPIIEDINLR